MNQESILKQERACVEQTLTALNTAGWRAIAVDNGDGSQRFEIDDVFATDECVVLLKHTEHGRGSLFVVLGNSPCEAVADCSARTEAALDNISEIVSAVADRFDY